MRTGCGLLLLVGGVLACGGLSVRAATPGRSGEKLVWSDEFDGTAAQSAPNAQNWTYDTGGGGWGNAELETYCAYGLNQPPCHAAQPNAYVGRTVLSTSWRAARVMGCTRRRG